MILKQEQEQPREQTQIEAEISKPAHAYKKDPRRRGQKLWRWNVRSGDVAEVPESDFIFSADVTERLIPVIDKGRAQVYSKKQMKSTKLVRVDDGFVYCVAINHQNAERKFEQMAVESWLRSQITKAKLAVGD